MARTDATKLRIALAQVNPTVGDIEANLAKISQLYAASEAAGCDIVMFPELSITGYPPEDLVLKAGFVAANQEAMGNFARTTGTCVAVVGFVDGSTDLELYNAAAVISGGVVHDVYRKQLLPNYSVFDEQRYFTPGDSFSLYQIGGVHVGVTICEDIWDASGPVRQQAQAGAAINININGSPYHRGKIGERAAMIGERAKDNHCAIAYVNQVCGQDELVFDGGSMVFDHTGTLVARSPQFVEDLLIVDIDVASPKLRRGTRVVAISSAPRNKPSDLQAVITKEETDLEQVFGALVLGTRDYVRKNGFTDVVIGLSGGIDSALVAAIAVEALGAQHVHGVSMPSRYSSEGSRTDAAALATALGIDLQTISIEPAFEAYLSMTQQSFAGKQPDLTEENLQSRVRGTTLMALSNKFGWMVLTTGNKSEMATGYSTLYGDMAGGFAVIKDVAKMLVFELCRDLNTRTGREVIPSNVIAKPPSAELRPDQKDEDSLPPYAILDRVIEAYVERDLSLGEIEAEGFDRAVIEQVIRLVDRSEYKRRQSPPGVRVTPKAFGKDRRLPITNRWYG